QHNTTQHNTTQHNTTQHNTTQHNTTVLNICNLFYSMHYFLMQRLYLQFFLFFIHNIKGF
ncbi:hypothetical protein, partial [uncultured Brachyspira sp.]|uniref:hypothetical protein n=1 Tax=uncultured Brachyspira sp. TaxID=221953 RepID=UPI00263538E5